MFCPKCGKNASDEARFCPACGHQFAQRKNAGNPSVGFPQSAGNPHSDYQQSIATQPRHAAGLFSDKVKVLAIVDILLIMATLVPWVSVNVYVYSQSFSLLDLATMIFRVNELGTSYFGTTFSSSDLAMWLTIVAVVIGVLWLATVVTLGVDAYERLKKGKGSVAAFAVALLCAVIVIICCFALDAAIVDQLGSYVSAAAGIVSATPWAWVYAIATIACIVVQTTVPKPAAAK